jgi:phage terminase small subunit
MFGGEHKGGQVRLSMTDVVKLTEKQYALVDTLVAEGCSITEAAGKAGYAEGESGRVSASRALRQPHVQAYMMQRVGETLGVNATTAAARLVRLATGAKSEYVQLEASKDILDRAGFKAPDKHMHLHSGDIKVSIDLS